MILKDWLDNKYTKKEMNNLTVLYCTGKGITSLKGIEQLNKLVYLNCNNNKLTSLKGIEKLDKLEMLSCHNNPLPYSDLYDFSKLKLELIKELRQDKISKLLLL